MIEQLNIGPTCIKNDQDNIVIKCVISTQIDWEQPPCGRGAGGEGSCSREIHMGVTERVLQERVSIDKIVG